MLEPLTCQASSAVLDWAAATTANDEIGMAVAEAAGALWSVSLVGGRATPVEQLLPAGLVHTSHGAEWQVAGVLSRAALEEWIVRLQLRGSVVVAAALRQVMQAHLAPAPVLRWGRFCLDLARPQLMGVINVTPDSFSGDGLYQHGLYQHGLYQHGLYQHVAAAVAQGVRMAAEGADILDVGGESSRPGAVPVGSAEELERVVPVVQALVRAVDLPVAVDTCKPVVMQAALEAGAAMINDITALRPRQLADDVGLDHLAGHEVPVVLMHMQGKPDTMQIQPTYRHVCAEVYAFLSERIRWCVDHGIAWQRLLADPGIGFGKSHAHNLALLRHLRVFRGLGVPLLVGVSRKRLVGAISGEAQAGRRDLASHILGALAVVSGAHILRVHDVAGARQALAVAHAWSHGLEDVP